MRTPREWLYDLVQTVIRNEMEDGSFRDRIEAMEEDILTAEKRVNARIEGAISRVRTLVQNEMGKIVWGHVQRHERDEFIGIRSDIEHLGGKIMELREALNAAKQETREEK